MKKEFTVDELNEIIIERITDMLTNFCSGKYKDEQIYPVVFSSGNISSKTKKANLTYSCSAQKTGAGILRNVRVSINKVEPEKKKLQEKNS